MEGGATATAFFLSGCTHLQVAGRLELAQFTRGSVTPALGLTSSYSALATQGIPPPAGHWKLQWVAHAVWQGSPSSLLLGSAD